MNLANLLVRVAITDFKIRRSSLNVSIVKRGLEAGLIFFQREQRRPKPKYSLRSLVNGLTVVMIKPSIQTTAIIIRRSFKTGGEDSRSKV